MILFYFKIPLFLMLLRLLSRDTLSLDFFHLFYVFYTSLEIYFNYKIFPFSLSIRDNIELLNYFDLTNYLVTILNISLGFSPKHLELNMI